MPFESSALRSADARCGAPPASGVHARKPRAGFHAQLAVGDQVCKATACGRSCRSRSGDDVSWMASVRSRPTRSAFSSGPSTESRRPKLFLTHGVERLRVADAVCDHRDRLSPERMLKAIGDEAGDVLAGRARASCPATRSSAGRRLDRFARSRVLMTSTSGTRCGGFHQCVPTMRARRSFRPRRSRRSESRTCCSRGSRARRSGLELREE